MRVPALGEAVTHLPWLCPCAASLVTLARAPGATAWPRLRLDPAAVLLVVRHATPTLAVPTLSFFPALLQEPAIVEGALHHLRQDYDCFVDWNEPSVRPIYHACLRYAEVAEHVAQESGKCDPENAWVAGLLAPLGWLAICATDAQQAAACLADPEFAQQPAATEQRYWGLEQAALARRLARRWRLPPWLAAVAGHLGLPLETAQSLGADPDLFRLIQFAVGLVQQQGKGLALPVGSTPAETIAALGLPAAVLASSQLVSGSNASPESLAWTSPTDLPLLPDLLALAADNRRLCDAPVMQRLERDIDDLHHALEAQRAGEADRLQARKLSALAELAAGAGHEINNPLAVISGQAQYLLSHEDEAARRRALQTIIGQTQRIHQILNDLMQFARPSRPQKQPVDLAALVRDVSISLSDLAIQRRVQLVCPEAEQPLAVYADPKHLRTALTCLLRNAIEAAPEEGWAGVRLATAEAEQVELVVEDSGNGPPQSLREHLFDPFYSGRSAGRGRGLGLPTAWRLAREQGGDVRFVELADGPTRFVLSLPRETGSNGTAGNGCIGLTA